MPKGVPWPVITYSRQKYCTLLELRSLPERTADGL